MAAIQSVERDYISSQLRMRDTEAELESLSRQAADMKEEIDIQDAEMFDLQVSPVNPHLGFTVLTGICRYAWGRS